MALPYSQYYIQDLQGMKDRIENQIRQYQNQQQAPITQNFQITPTPGEIDGKYATNIDEVRNTFVTKTGLFVNRDFNTLWVKDISGKIRTFNLEEVVELDHKDKEILDLKKDYELELYEMAYGRKLNQELAEKIVRKMKPYGERWTLNDARDIQMQFGTHEDDIDFYVVLNSAYNDFRDIFQDNIDNYVRYTIDFIKDEDAKPHKVFNYFTKIV